MGIYFFALLVFLYAALPIVWVILTSFKTKSEIYAYPPSLFPINFVLENYKAILLESQYRIYFLNSIIVTIFATSLVMVFGIISGYSYSSAFEYKGKNALMIFIIIARMIPEIAIIIPLYFFIQKIGLFDTKIGLVLMNSAMAYPLATWLLKSFFDGLPTSLYDAAKIDGCNIFTILRRIVLPISGPSISSTLIISFLTIWNSFLIPLTFAKTPTSKTFPVAVAELAYGEYGVNWGSLAAISILAIIPVFLLAIFAQKYVIAGLTGGAEKG